MKTTLIIGAVALAAWYIYNQSQQNAGTAVAQAAQSSGTQAAQSGTQAAQSAGTSVTNSIPSLPQSIVQMPVSSMPVNTPVPLIPTRVVADPVIMRPAPIVPQVFTPAVSLMPSPNAAKVAAVQAQQQGAYAFYLKTHPSLNLMGLSGYTLRN